MSRGEVVDERERRRHPPSQRLVGGIAEEGVEPDHPPRSPLDAQKLTRQEFGLTGIPAVGKHDDDRSTVDDV